MQMSPVFHMFLSSPPDGTAVASVYREKRPFGPYVVDGAPGFSVGIIMEIAEAAPAQFRSVRTCCAGLLQIVGVQAGSDPTEPDAPLVVALQPHSTPASLLKNVGRKAEFEPPLAFIYIGLDPASLKENLIPVITALDYFSGLGEILTPEQRWEKFREGQEPLDVPRGFVLAEVSNKNLLEGFRSVGFAARTNWMANPDVITDPLNFLDPVRLYQRLITEKLEDGTDVVPPEEVRNSWLNVATKNRVMFTVRDEWNAPIIDGTTSAVITDGTLQDTILLTLDRQGTFLAPPAMNRYAVSIAGRKLTRISKPGSGPTNQESFSDAAPAHHVIGSVRPEDWFHPQDPLLTDPTKQLWLYTENNKVTSLIDGLESFFRIVRDLKKINAPNHFFLFTNWWTIHTFELIPGNSTTTLKKMMEDINAAGAPVRGLIYHHFVATGLPLIGLNVPAHEFINGMTHGQSVLDSRLHHAWLPVPLLSATWPLTHLGVIGIAAIVLEIFGLAGPQHMGAHHSKTSVISNNDGTCAYIGGIDFNPNRLDDTSHPVTGTRFHDVHARIAGPAAEDLTKAFVNRWSDHPENQATARRLRIAPPSACPAGETCILPMPSVPSADATCMVQIAQTFGATTLSYAPNGDRTIWATLAKGIARARKYIYVEDQYLVSPELSAALLAALPRIQHLIVVMDHDGESFLLGRLAMERARYLFLKPLRDLNTQKLHVFTLVKDGSPYKVHTKVVIIDDVFTTIGSANMNRRGFTHDTEANAFFLDGRIEDGARKFARDLRIKLWGEHLGWDPLRSTGRLSNIDQAVKIITRNRPVTSRLQPYDYTRGEGSTQWTGWDELIDPDGTLPPT